VQGLYPAEVDTGYTNCTLTWGVLTRHRFSAYLLGSNHPVVVGTATLCLLFLILIHRFDEYLHVCLVKTLQAKIRDIIQSTTE
jgi:hypothetical protein